MRSLYATIGLALILGVPPARGDDLPLEKFKLPPGFAIELVARVPNAREMALATGGTVFVGSIAPLAWRFAMGFYTGAQFPAAYRNQIFIAEHGSWNRSKKIGYRVTLVRVENNRAVGYEPFATGWLQGETAWGRPADVLVMLDGSLLVSDDLAAIYRIRYTGKG